tara:strand:+ start:364 stop:624 length:261 start_codon:yes stop_codon:yes gene_type:complete
MYSKSKEYNFNWSELKVGDYVFEVCERGFVADGYTYGIGMIVRSFDNIKIECETSEGEIIYYKNPIKQESIKYDEEYLMAFQSNNT